ncbi:MAG: hypothetical protein NC131_06250 [Roseburia sp.]|nr:hypothetical protein [Roseburia sp.]
MAQTINITLSTVLGNVKIYANPKQQRKAEELLKKTPHILQQAYINAASRFGERLSKMAKTCLRKGMPPPNSGVSWPPHAASTTRRLGEHTLLYWSSQYYHAIGVYKRGKNVFVGVKSGVKKTRPDNAKSRLTLLQVAKILEFGGGRVPARPLWIPLFESVGGKRQFKQELVKEIRKQMRKYTQ